MVEGDFPFLAAVVDGVRVDILPSLVPIAWERAINLPLTRSLSLRLVDLDGLLQLKLRAGGPRDLMDVAALVLLHPAQRQRALDLATPRGLLDKLEMWLDDPRLRAEIDETRAEERAMSRPR